MRHAAILLGKNNPDQAELTLRALHNNNLAKEIIRAREGMASFIKAMRQLGWVCLAVTTTALISAGV